MHKRLIFLAAGLIAFGWVIALAGEVTSQRTARMGEWLRDRELRTDRDDATMFDRLKASSWPGYVLSAVVAGYTAMVLVGIPVAGARAGRLRIAVGCLSMLGLTIAGWRLAGDWVWSLWEIGGGDMVSVSGFMLALYAISQTDHSRCGRTEQGK